MGYKKMNKNKSEYTFDDLIDVAVQAIKDMVIEVHHFTKDHIEYGAFGEAAVDAWRSDQQDEIEDHIEYIKSLYTETFVIEDYKDIKRIKNKADIKLANDLLVKAYADPKRYEEGWAVKCADGNQSGTLDIFALKGATVTQRRGKK